MHRMWEARTATTLEVGLENSYALASFPKIEIYVCYITLGHKEMTWDIYACYICI